MNWWDTRLSSARPSRPLAASPTRPVGRLVRPLDAFVHSLGPSTQLVRATRPPIKAWHRHGRQLLRTPPNGEEAESGCRAGTGQRSLEEPSAWLSFLFLTYRTTAKSLLRPGCQALSVKQPTLASHHSPTASAAWSWLLCRMCSADCHCCGCVNWLRLDTGGSFHLSATSSPLRFRSCTSRDARPTQKPLKQARCEGPLRCQRKWSCTPCCQPDWVTWRNEQVPCSEHLQEPTQNWVPQPLLRSAYLCHIQAIGIVPLSFKVSGDS